MHTVPALKHGDLILNDSATILLYLSERFGEHTNMFPKDFTQRLKIIDKLLFNATVLFKRDSETFVSYLN